MIGPETALSLTPAQKMYLDELLYQHRANVQVGGLADGTFHAIMPVPVAQSISGELARYIRQSRQLEQALAMPATAREA